MVRQWLPPRPKNTHKGLSGRVLVVAGSRGMSGAAVLCATGAVRSGAGLVRLAIVKSQQEIAVKWTPLEVTSQPLPEDKEGQVALGAAAALKKMMGRFRPHVLALGPGLGVSSAVNKLVDAVVMRGKLPVVLDADGLNALSAVKQKKFLAPVIITPHAGELARLLNVSVERINREREKSAAQAARRFGCVCLLKGAGTIVTDGKTFYRNTTGNPGMASGGMGDVLTGIIAALWVQRVAPKPAQDPRRSALEAAAAGAYIHGLAGDLAIKKFPERTLLASDLASYLPDAFQKI